MNVEEHPRRVRILEVDANRRGDLFGRLMADLFLALGYHRDARLNIHKSGREIDLEAEHRVEARVAIAECKATATAIGGSDVNKFAGALEAERRRHAGRQPPRAVTGYFVSLSGFTATATEQEREFVTPRLIMMDAGQVVRQLVEGNVLASEQIAVERAAALVNNRAGLCVDGPVELMAHEVGWVWVVYFGRDKERTHYVLVHADGTPLGSAPARRVAASDALVRGFLDKLIPITPTPQATSMSACDAVDRYRQHLRETLSEITLEGLPADEEVGSRRFTLDELFVPLNLIAPDQQPSDSDASTDEEDGHDKIQFVSRDHTVSDPGTALTVSQALSQYRRLAITGGPGAGKTTLLKKIALTYAASGSSAPDAADGLPAPDWVSVLLRCRSISNVRRPIQELLREVPARAEMPEEDEAFSAAVSELLREGRLLLLVDGLDEIADDGDRTSFVRQLRTLIATYPGVSLVVTSRPRGFRSVASVLATTCERFDIADLSDDDIRLLTERWHRAVLGSAASIDEESRGLAEAIIETERVRSLATSPLLLTTLLLVRRWVGELPRKRAVLYGKAIEVLLMTWNVEAHEPIEPDEAIPQLAFVAFSMTRDGMQRVSRRRLTELLQDARSELPEILAYARTSVAEFVDRVEGRSSMLVLSGHAEENGQIVPVYEFKHLTFQEYLAALAAVEGYVPSNEGASPEAVLEDRLLSQEWNEVVVLTAVLAGRRAAPIVELMLLMLESSRDVTIDEFYLEDDENGGVNTEWLLAGLLARCLSDEVQVPPALVKERRFGLAKVELAYRSPWREVFCRVDTDRRSWK